MLNLDFLDVQEGLVMNKALFPLHVPQGGLEIGRDYGRGLVWFEPGRGLDIPHSSLLDPDGSEWIFSARVFVQSNGMIMAQSNGELGYAIYTVDGGVRASLRTSHATITLAEDPARGISDRMRRWTTIELRIKEDMAYLSLNRTRIAMAWLDAPLKGEKMTLRLGSQPALPAFMERVPGATPIGFVGAMSSVKLLRQ